MHLRKNPYREFLDTLEKPARYIGGEYFSVVKDWDTTQTKVALCFPDAYEIGMSHLGFKILYDELNRSPDILADRVFAPWMDCEKEIRKRDLELVSLEQFRSLKEFDILGFSLQYELTYTNILNMLDLSHVSIFQKDRLEHEPFVIAGGPCATHPEPIAPFMDFIVIGDGEDLFVRLADFIGKARVAKVPRQEILEILAHWKGIYVPSLYSTYIDEKTDLEVVGAPLLEGLPERIERFFVEDLKNYPIPTKAPIPHMTAIFDRFSVELARGCTEGCRFCQAGMIYRPVRERRPEHVIASVMEGMRLGGFNEASLTCLSTADYSAITPLLLDLLDKMNAEEATLGISSLRAYGLDNRIFDKMAEVKNSSLTFAPEGGTERMRKVINKNITEADMLKTAEDVFGRGWHKMKLYFMIGLPTETDEDVQGIMETGRKARQIGLKLNVHKPEVNISASTFVPKPHTPFQWSSMIPLSEIERKQEMLFRLSRDYRLNFRKHLSKSSFIEGLVARGDRRVGQVIYDAWKEGARFDGWDETFDFTLWLRCIEKNNVELPNYLGTIRMDGKLPWDHIDVGLEARFLENEWKRAIKDRSSPPCGKPNKEIVHYSSLEALNQAHEVEKKKLVCYHCGIKCDLKGMVEERKEFLTSLQAVSHVPYVRPEVSGKEKKRARVLAQNNMESFHYRVGLSKIGPISFISHLDLQKVIARIFKRSELVVLNTLGFNPRPQISFGPALTLGISSLSEHFDVRVPAPWDDLENVLKLLNNNSEKGLFFRDIVAIDNFTPSIQDGAKFFKYFIPVRNPEQIPGVLERLKSTEEISVRSYSKKHQNYVTKNIRQFLTQVEENDLANLKVQEDLVNLIDEVSPCRGMRGIVVTAELVSGSGVRPNELRECFTAMGLEVEKPIKTDVLWA